MPEYCQLQQPDEFNTRDIHATIDPRKLEYGVLQRADAPASHDSRCVSERPIYFARSAVGYPRTLGLENYVITQGLASKLFVPPANGAQTKDTLLIQGDGWLDVARTQTLWNDVFTGHQSVIKEGQWVDRPSVSMPALYIFMGAELADALRAIGRPAEANKVFATTKQVAAVTGLDGLIRGLEEQITAPQLTGDQSNRGSITISRVQSTGAARKEATEIAGYCLRRSVPSAAQCRPSRDRGASRSRRRGYGNTTTEQ